MTIEVRHGTDLSLRCNQCGTEWRYEPGAPTQCPDCLDHLGEPVSDERAEQLARATRVGTEHHQLVTIEGAVITGDKRTDELALQLHQILDGCSCDYPLPKRTAQAVAALAAIDADPETYGYQRLGEDDTLTERLALCEDSNRRKAEENNRLETKYQGERRTSRRLELKLQTVRNMPRLDPRDCPLGTWVLDAAVVDSVVDASGGEGQQ